MTRNQIVFVLIIGAAIAIVSIGFALQTFSGGDSSNSDSTKVPPTTVKDPITIEVAVTSLAEPWIAAAAKSYTGTVNGQPVIVKVEIQESLDIWGAGGSVWTPLDHPTVWIPEAGYAVGYANEVGMKFTIKEASLARTPLIWGAYETRSNVIISKYGSFDAQAVQSAAKTGSWQTLGGNSRWNFVTLTFPRPDQNAVGLAALLSFASQHNNAAELTDSMLADSQLQTWLEPIVDAVPNFSTLGGDPAQVMATRGISTGDFGLLPEIQWLTQLNALNNVETFKLYYPQGQYFVLDFPFAIWSDVPEDQRKAAEDFAQYLLSENQQRAAAERGLRPNSRIGLDQFPIFSTPEFQAELTGTPIELPSRGAILSLLRWFSSYRTAS